MPDYQIKKTKIKYITMILCLNLWKDTTAISTSAGKNIVTHFVLLFKCYHELKNTNRGGTNRCLGLPCLVTNKLEVDNDMTTAYKVTTNLKMLNTKL
jgi:hypothetical protein